MCGDVIRGGTPIPSEASRSTNAAARRPAILALLATVLIWGSSFIVAKAALREVGPLTLNALRFLVAFPILLVPAWRRGYRLRLYARPTFWWFGLTGVVLYYTLQNVGLVYTSALGTALVLSIIPAVTALLAAWLLNERLAARQWVGIGLALAGAALVGLATGSSQDAPRPWLGNLMILGSVLAWAIYTIQGKRLSAAYPAVVATTAATGAGLLLLLPLAVGEVALAGWPRFTLVGALAILYLALASTALPMFLWNVALSHVGASVASAYLNLVPIVGVGLALLAGEAVSPWQVVGGVLALLGVWISSRTEPST
jgi:drug/metabolite transporter (DMT)-like permease